MVQLMELLNSEMIEPKPWGWFHLLWVGITIFFLILFFITRNKTSEKETKIVLSIYGIVALILEILKQIAWSYNLDPNTGKITFASAATPLMGQNQKVAVSSALMVQVNLQYQN